jgi:tetratricopeptide (TPR) repeat protein
MKKHLASIIFLILLLSSFASSWGQQQPQQVPQVIRIRPPQEEEKDDYRKNIDLVNELLRTGKPEDALQVLDQMKSVYGETEDIHRLYKDAYIAAKQYDKAEQIIRADMDQSPNNWRLYCELANVYFKAERGEEARQNLNHAIELLPDGPNVYREVASVYLRNSMTSEAMDTYRRARMKLSMPALFSLDMASLYEALFDYKQAIDEYFLFMGDDSTKFAVVEDRINKMIQSDENLDQIELALAERTQRNPQDIYSHKLHGDVLFRQEKLDRAFEVYKKIDELSKSRGKYILTFIHMCHTAGYHDRAVQASQYLVSTQPSKEVVVSAKTYIAFSQEAQEKYQDAIETYQSIIDEFGKDFPLEGGLSHYRMGWIQLHHLKRPDEAFVHFQSVISDFPDSPLYPNALVRRGDCLTADGDLDSAQVLYEKALRSPRSEPTQEELKYQLAELEFYRGNFEAALDGYRQLLEEFPKGLYINNSLERTIVITENQDLDRPMLTKFAGALLDNVEGKTDSAIIKLDQLISAKSQKLADLAQLTKAKIWMEEKEPDRSLDALAELLDEYPESLLRAQAQMLIGDLYNYHLHDRSKAIEAYRKLLKDYDRSVYVDQVRDKLRELKAELPPASSG